MVNLLEIPRMVVFFVNYMIEMIWLFQKRSCVLSSYNENQDVATMGTLSDQFNVVNNNALRAFHCQCHVLYRYKTRSLRSKMP